MSKRLREKMNKSIVMLMLILAGITYSQIADAGKPPKSKVSRSMVRASRQNNSNKACYLLHKKRTARPVATVSIKRAKTKPMAETDSPYGNVTPKLKQAL